VARLRFPLRTPWLPQLLNRPRYPLALRKEKRMTVCIAAIAGQPNRTKPYIVTASDTMVYGSTFSADMNTVKSEPFHANWTAMMAADDLTQCVPIIEKAKEYFEGRKNTLAVARAVFKRAFQRHVVEMREDAVLGAYGLKMADFLKSGKRRFTERQYDSMCRKMEAIDPKCEFIIWGFDGMKRPHIFHVDGLGSDAVFDKPGFCSIGSGKWAAEAMLFYLGQSMEKNLEETLFNVCAAKFSAERYGIGKHTYVFARHFGSAMFSWENGMLEHIREVWEQRGCPRVPEGAIEQIRSYNPRCLPE